MKYTVENDFAKHVKSDELYRVYLLHGAQTFLIEHYEKLLEKKALSGRFDDFNLHRFEGDTLDMQAFYDAVESLPFFSEARCVTLDLEPDKLDAGQVEELCKVLEDPPATTTVLLTVKQPPQRRDKLAALVKVCDKAGCVAELGDRRGNDTQRFLRNRAPKYGCELPGDCAAYLVERCGDDLQTLDTELQKLCAYAGGGTITRAQIDEVAIPLLQARVFDLSKAILRGNFDRAMELADQLDALREPAGKVLAVLSSAFVDLYRGYAVRQEGVPTARAVAELGYPKNREFVLKNAMSDSGAFTGEQLGKLLEVLAEADGALKSTGLGDRLVLEETVTKLFLLTGRR